MFRSDSTLLLKNIVGQIRDAKSSLEEQHNELADEVGEQAAKNASSVSSLQTRVSVLESIEVKRAAAVEARRVVLAAEAQRREEEQAWLREKKQAEDALFHFATRSNSAVLKWERGANTLRYNPGVLAGWCIGLEWGVCGVMVEWI